MPFKVIINVDLETGESDNFLWAEKEEPPPLVRGRIKKLKIQDLDKEKSDDKSERKN